MSKHPVKVSRARIATRALAFALFAAISIYGLRALLPGSFVTLGGLLVVLLFIGFLWSMRRR